MADIQKKHIWKKWWFWVGFVILAAIFSASTSNPSTQTSATPAPTATAVAVLFDLSSAKGKTPEQIYTLLGEPTKKDAGPNAAQKELIKNGQKWEMNDTWEKDGHTFLMSYDYTTRVVTDFFLNCSENGTGTCPNTAETINTLKAKLNAEASGMKVEPTVTFKDKTKITGIKLVP